MRLRIAILAIPVLLALGIEIEGADSVSTVREQFLAELKTRGIQSRELGDGRIELDFAGKALYVSLENLERNVARDNNADAVKRFIEKALSPPSLPAEWARAKSGVRFSAEPMDSELGDVLWDAVSKEVRKV